MSGMGKRAYSHSVTYKPYERSPWMHTDMGENDVQWFLERAWNHTLMSRTFFLTSIVYMCQDSTVGIANCYGLEGPRIKSWLAAISSTPAQASPGAHPASYTMATGSFSGVKRPGRGIDRPPPHLALRLKKEYSCVYSPSGSSWSVLGQT